MSPHSALLPSVALPLCLDPITQMRTTLRPLPAGPVPRGPVRPPCGATVTGTCGGHSWTRIWTFLCAGPTRDLPPGFGGPNPLGVLLANNGCLASRPKWSESGPSWPCSSSGQDRAQLSALAWDSSQSRPNAGRAAVTWGLTGLGGSKSRASLGGGFRPRPPRPGSQPRSPLPWRCSVASPCSSARGGAAPRRGAPRLHAAEGSPEAGPHPLLKMPGEPLRPPERPASGRASRDRAQHGSGAVVTSARPRGRPGVTQGGPQLRAPGSLSQGGAAPGSGGSGQRVPETVDPRPQGQPRACLSVLRPRWLDRTPAVRLRQRGQQCWCPPPELQGPWSPHQTPHSWPRPAMPAAPWFGRWSRWRSAVEWVFPVVRWQRELGLPPRPGGPCSR